MLFGSHGGVPKSRTPALLPVFVSLTLACLPVAADPPPWSKGKGKSARDDHDERHVESHAHGHDHFSDQHRMVVREYYENEFRRGSCPPGLAKKHNGCMPPGQAKKWQVGRPLPPDVVYYQVPQPLVVQLGAPPAGYRYVRVASDILMIAVGTSIVAAAIQDLGRS